MAHKINAEIICADSRIVYKDFDIVSAKPTIAEQEGIVHHLIDIIDANCDFSAGDFCTLARKIIDNTNKNIIITGGTWFYIKSLLDNKMLPECSFNLELRKELEELESNILWEKLNILDSNRAQKIHPNNKDKIIRSIELCYALKMPVSEYIRKDNTNYQAFWYKTELDRDVLYERINKRVDMMIELGLYDEWCSNKEKYPESKVLRNTIGYSEFFDYQNIDLAIDKIKQHTRNFAKRQLTYYRSRDDIQSVCCCEDIDIF